MRKALKQKTILFIIRNGSELTNDTAKMEWDKWYSFNRCRYSVITDMWQKPSQDGSHYREPEHSIVYVNEITKNDTAPDYDDIAYAGLRLASAKEWTSFSEFSAYFTRGIKVRRVVSSRSDIIEASNLFPDIAHHLLTDTKNGLGGLVGNRMAQFEGFVAAADFCEAMNFYWDGVIPGKINIRQWLYETAQFHLLDLTVIGGCLGLRPAYPVGSANRLRPDGKVTIKALFTDGNIQNLKTSFLDQSDRQLFTASVLYREEQPFGFPETRTINVSYKNSQTRDWDPIETFDCTQFMTSEDHALAFAKHAISQRKNVDHSVTFQTTPDCVANLAPGECFRLASEVMHQYKNGPRYSTGTITDNGDIQASQKFADGSYTIWWWKPGQTQVVQKTMQVTNGKCATASLRGALFCQTFDELTTRTYKCEQISYSEEGLIEVVGTHFPTTSSGVQAVLEWDDSLYNIERGSG